MTNCINLKLTNEFEKLWNRVENNENLCILRYGDGERAIMTGKSVVAQEKWESPNYISKLGYDLLETLNLTGKNIYHGISCPCCDEGAFYWYSTRIQNQQKTFANLFVNANYTNFIEKFGNLKRDAIFIGNYRAKNKQIGKLNVLKSYYVSDDCFSFWENDAEEMINSIINDFGNIKDLLYVVSAGPMSEVIISKLYKNNPNNCYIDFGSSIDKFIHNKITRDYMKPGEYQNKNCEMPLIEMKDYEITVILNAYKRLKTLPTQLKVIKSQTIKPTEILLFQDKVADEADIKISKELLSQFDAVKISDINKGCWGRFEYAKDNAKSKFVCIFDDDTIPGDRWLENCIKQMQKEEALYGTIGILMKDPTKYPKEMIRFGWDSSNKKTTQVDFVGHSWFAKKDWLYYLFDGTERYQQFKTAAEDMCFSAQLQKQGIKTLVPPHPYRNKAFWGSLPEYAIELGGQENAISVNQTNLDKMNKAMNMIIEDGFVPQIKSNRLHTNVLYYKMKLARFICKLLPYKKVRRKSLQRLRSYICG